MLGRGQLPRVGLDGIWHTYFDRAPLLAVPVARSVAVVGYVEAIDAKEAAASSESMRALVRNTSLVGIMIALAACGLDLSVPGAGPTSFDASRADSGAADVGVGSDAAILDAGQPEAPSSVRVEVKQGEIDTLPPGTAEPCSKGGRDVTLDIVNDTSEIVEVFDVGFDCRESSIGFIDPGESDSTRTSERHRWRLKTTTGVLLLDFVVARGPVEIRLR